MPTDVVIEKAFREFTKNNGYAEKKRIDQARRMLRHFTERYLKGESDIDEVGDGLYRELRSIHLPHNFITQELDSMGVDYGEIKNIRSAFGQRLNRERQLLQREFGNISPKGQMGSLPRYNKKVVVEDIPTVSVESKTPNASPGTLTRQFEDAEHEDDVNEYVRNFNEENVVKAWNVFRKNDSAQRRLSAEKEYGKMIAYLMNEYRSGRKSEREVMDRISGEAEAAPSFKDFIFDEVRRHSMRPEKEEPVEVGPSYRVYGRMPPEDNNIPIRIEPEVHITKPGTLSREAENSMHTKEVSDNVKEFNDRNVIKAFNNWKSKT